MVLGIGIDVVGVAQMRELLADMSEPERATMFTPDELARSREAADPDEYLATRFAAKEAVTKAIAPLVPAGSGCDMRVVETLNRPDGSPYVRVGVDLGRLMEGVGASRVHVSISTEGERAYAFVVLEG